MVPELLRRQRVAVVALVSADLVVVALVAATQPTDGVISVVAALVLAPVAIAATAALAARIGSDRFALGAAAVYVVLPLLGNRYMLPTYRGTFDTRALPSLVGTQHTLVLALGIAAAVAFLLAPKALAAAGGVLAFVVTAAIWQFAGVGQLRPGLHESVWSIAFIEWLLLAGILAALLRAPLLGLAVGGWLSAAILWGAHRGYGDAVFWRSLAVAVPAGAVLLSSLALLAPRLRPASSRAPSPSRR